MAGSADCVIVNRDLAMSVAEVAAIVTAECLRRTRLRRNSSTVSATADGFSKSELQMHDRDLSILTKPSGQ